MRNPLRGMLIAAHGTITAASRATGMDKQRLRRITRGEGRITPEEILRIAHSCGVPPGDVCSAAAEVWQQQQTKKDPLGGCSSKREAPHNGN